MKRIITISMILAIIFSFTLLNSCGSDDDDSSANFPLSGVWKGKMGSDPNDRDMTIEFTSTTSMKAFVFGLIIEGTYVYNETEKKITMETKTYKSLGSSETITGNIMGSQEPWTNVSILDNTLTVTETSKNDDGTTKTETLTFTKQTTAFPTESTIDATTVDCTVTGATSIANQYYFIMAAVEGIDGPAGIYAGIIAADGKATAKVYIENSFLTSATMDVRFLAFPFDPATFKFGDSDPTKTATYIGLSNASMQNEGNTSITKSSANSVALDYWMTGDDFRAMSGS